MNQAASATSRPPAGSTATASCCPMFNNPFFINTFAPQTTLLPPPPTAQQCFLGSQANQIQPISSIQPQTAAQHQLNAVLQHQPTVSQQPAGPNQSDRSQRPRDQSNHNSSSSNINLNSNSYNTSFNGPAALSLQHLLANRHPSTHCVALAAALASASLPHFQQLQQHQSQQNHHQSSTTNSTSNTTTTNSQPNVDSISATTNNSSVNSAPHINLNTVATPTPNQVPIQNFNSYNTAPQNLNLPTQNAPPPPVAAHLSQGGTSQPQSNPPASSQVPIDVGSQNRPLATNTTINNVENLQPHISLRRTPLGQVVRSQQLPQQTPPVTLTAQHLAQAARATLSDETLSLLNEQFQATFIINQILANSQFGTLGPVPMQQQQQHVLPSQPPTGTQTNPTRSQFNLPNQVPLTIPSAQQVQSSYAPQARLEQVSSQQQQHFPQNFQQSSAQSTARLTQVPAPTDNTQSSVGSVYQQTQQAHHATIASGNQQPRGQAPVESNVQAQPIHGSTAPAPQAPPQPQTIPSVPLYPLPQMEQALALFANPVANSLISQLFSNIYFPGGLRPEQHAHHNPSHHFHHHLHGSHHHHHHHHGANGQTNGADASLPVDSLAISESKPKGLNRAEIDSLTHYIHTDEKDSRVCVICLSKFELKSKIRPLSCNHAFHAKCVDKWLRANRTCPICRRDALKTYEGKIKRI